MQWILLRWVVALDLITSSFPFLLFSGGRSSHLHPHLHLPGALAFPRHRLVKSSPDRRLSATGASSAMQQQQQQQQPQEELVDRSTLILLEHVNLNVPTQQHVLDFYCGVLGCGLDPCKVGNLVLPQQTTLPKTQTLWANAGASQFHLPYGEVAQVIPGHVGLRYDSLDGLKQRLASLGTEKESCVRQVEMGMDPRTQREFVRVMDRYGNVFVCRTGGNPVREASWQQPLVTEAPAAWPSEYAERYGNLAVDCRGIEYVEFRCPVGTAATIALFYDSVLDATADVVTDPATGHQIAVIAIGYVNEQGRADQSLLFRETNETTDDEADDGRYEGYHVALYVGESSSDFEQAFKHAEMANVVWVNPRFSDKAYTLVGAKQWQQFRFKDLVDLQKHGAKVFELEHEMRSIHHEAFPGKVAAFKSGITRS